MKNKLILLGVLLVLLVVALALESIPVSRTLSDQPAVQEAPADVQLSEYSYICNDGKTIEATYVPESVGGTGGVVVKLDDGRILSLPQAISASGARFANQDESFVFWSKGNTAFVTEGDPEVETFANCVEVQ